MKNVKKEMYKKKSTTSIWIKLRISPDGFCKYLNRIVILLKGKRIMITYSYDTLRTLRKFPVLGPINSSHFPHPGPESSYRPHVKGNAED